MPIYKFKDTKKKKIWEEFMTISERTSFLETNPHIEQMVNGFPSDADSVKLGRTKPDHEFRNLLKQIKKNNQGSDINTFD